MRNLNYILIAVACWHTEEFCIKWDALMRCDIWRGSICEVLLWLELGAYIEAGYLGAYLGTTDPAVCCLLLPMALGVWSCLLPCIVCLGLIPF